jgi:hypothetical protein
MFSLHDSHNIAPLSYSPMVSILLRIIP